MALPRVGRAAFPGGPGVSATVPALGPPVESALAAEDDARGAAARAFRRRLAPLLDFAAEPGRFPGLTDLFVDGDRITVAEGETLHGFTFADFPGLSPLHVRGAMHNASVYKDTPFGSRKPYFSVRMPPDLRVTCARPGIADTWHLSIRFLRARELTLDDYARDGVMDAAQRDAIRALVRERRNFLILGGTGAGKTTLLRAVLREIDTSRHRVLVIEDRAMSSSGTENLHKGRRVPGASQQTGV